MAAAEKTAGWPARIWAAIGGGLVALVGVLLLAGGGWLIFLQGSPYYMLAGAAVLATGVLLARRHPAAGLVYGVVLAVTLAWGLWEGGFEFWPLLPRLFAPAVLGLFILLVIPAAPKGRLRDYAGLAVAALSVACVGVLGAAVPATFSWGQAEVPAQITGAAPPAESASDWRYYGRDPGGSRYAPVDQINRENVGDLKVAWTFRTGEKPNRGSQDQNTPLQVGDTVYVCTPTNVVIAVDADTGKEKWRHDPKVKPGFWNRCRGVGYWDGSQPKVALSGTPAAATPAAKGAPPPAKAAPAKKPAAPAVQTTAAPTPGGPLCRRRIISSTINAQLFALDAETGQRCPGFGQNGMVNLSTGIGEMKPGFYFQTSTPTVIGNNVIIGGWVVDNQELAEPSGVVRAFNVVTGELSWAWDLGNPDIDKLPPEGQTYTRGTPNVWSTAAFDPDLGLIYLPVGNATPDYWGSHRSMASEAYSSSVVAVDAATGKMKWAFQTVHHDVWDYDVPAQPMLIDFPVKGGTAPALVQLTKRGQIFVLDRRTGEPLTRVVEVRVPGGAQPGEWVFPTQPYSVEMPTIGVERLTEEKMWGATPLDQLACRIKFLSVRYEGDFTPPGSPERPSLQYPGNAGGMNWGSGAYDARRGLLIVSDVRMPQTVSLAKSDKPEVALSRADKDRPPPSLKAIAYKARNDWFLSPVFAPCVQPPHGMLTAIDVRTRQVVWQAPAGTAESQAPFGLQSHLPIPIGTIGIGGPITTAGGVTFRAATTDPYLRAYDNATGKVLWKARLPIQSSATPMTYVSPKTGKQYVVVAAGGASMSPAKGDYVVAYALP
ncbi:MAG: membrane-bound PQQ-dependent dehydrogenase, glucose/quinate/shikimate family [Phenylobacterium sp.]|uniref:membrane-bound PQQ-dependent dehydrogenase, glucose/quinate/shikimate family n=1 Tax=Phenylobacterium sp. TaxID=1871053 RepID=UPI00122682C0|nr:membrane-bound PQQ-dependent dehydrogenase, glucose/quinate/shikimate family [Phenylobacterium sp.]TAJ73420.1 MAG: membrane-bound PQQ-dependent dehydrogenase, glucose/quinate/shikimate family [Phenylobacterium sp.]